MNNENTEIESAKNIVSDIDTSQQNSQFGATDTISSMPVVSGSVSNTQSNLAETTATQQPKSSFSANPRTQSPSTTSSESKQLVYVSAFAVSLAMVYTILISITVLLETSFNHIGKSKASTQAQGASSLYHDNYELKSIIWFSASLVISGVIYILLVRYLSKNSDLRLTSFVVKVYNLIYGAFLSILSIATVLSFINFVYSCFVQFVPKNDPDMSYTTSNAWWSGALQAFLTTTIMVVVLLFYYKKITSIDGK